MAQKNIDFGSFPDDPDADAIRTAFQKTQENFTEVFSGLAGQGVLSINKTKQTGITVNSPTGNVLISADFACLTVQSTTLSLQVSNGAAANTQVITNGSQVLQINLPATANLVNANLSGNLSVNGWANFGNATSNVIISNGNISATGILSITGNANVGNLGAEAGVFTGNVSAGNVSTGGTLTVTGNSNVGNLGTSGLIVATGNITGGNLNTSGSLSVTGNANVGNLGAAQGVFTSNVSAGNISVTGNVSANNFTGANLVSANFLTGTLTTNAQPNITSIGTLTGLDVNGNITAVNITANTGVFAGNGANLTNLTGANVTGQVGNALVAGTVYTNAQPNITSVGTLISLTVTGNISAGNVSGGNLVSANFIQGTLTTNAQPNITSVGTLSSLSVTGNLDSANLQTGNIVANANITAGNVYANSGTIGASLLTGTLTTNAQPNITSVGTLSSLSVSGNLSSGNANLGNLAIANFLQGDGYLISNLTVSAGTYIASGTSNIAILAPNGNVDITVGGTNILLLKNSGANITGTLGVSGNANIGNVGATRFVGNLEGGLLTNSQPNITSVGTLTGLTVNGLSNLGPNGNVIITGGASNSFLMTDGAGNLTWNTGTLVPAQGSNTQIIFNDSGSNYAGNTGFTFNKTSGNVAIPGALSVTGNISGNKITGTLVTAIQNNITEVGTLSYLIVTGNINAGNIAVPTGNISANLFIGNINGSNVTGQVGNALVAGTVYTAAQPNITSVGTLTSLGVNGNITAVNITANTGVISGNGSGLTALNASQISTGTLAQARLANSSLTINGTTIALGASGTITANVSQSHSNGSYITGGSYNGGTAITWAVDAVSTNTADKIVARDGNGSFSANVVTATNFVGNGAGLTNLTGANVTGQVANALVAGTVYTAAQPNITSVGTLTSLGVSGNITAANITANTGIFSGNGSGLTALNATQLTTGTVPSARLSGNYSINVDVANTVATAAQPNITSVGTLTSLAVTGNTTSGNFIGTFANGNSDISIPAANGNINFDVAGRANGAVLFTDSSTVTMIVGNQYPQTSNQNAHYTKIGKDIQLYRGNVLVLDATAAGTAPNSYVDMYVKGTFFVNASYPAGATAIEANGNVIIRGLTSRRIFSGSATGTSQATAASISSDIVNVTSVTSTNRGVVLPDGVIGNNGTTYWGYTITIRNSDSANNLYVYPGFGGGTINDGANNAAYLQAPGTVLTYICFSSANSATGTWYTNGATYA